MTSNSDFNLLRHRRLPMNKNEFCVPALKRKSFLETKPSFNDRVSVHHGPRQHRVGASEIRRQQRHRWNHIYKYSDKFCFSHLEVIPEKDLDPDSIHTACHVKHLYELEDVTRKDLNTLYDQTKKQQRVISLTTKQKLNDIEAQRDCALKEMSDYWQEIITNIKEHRQNLKKEIYRIFNEEIKRIHGITTKLMDDLHKLEASICEVQTRFAKHRKTVSFTGLPDMIIRVIEARIELYEPTKPFKVPDCLKTLEKYVYNMNFEDAQKVRSEINSCSDSAEMDSEDLSTNYESGMFSLDMDSGDLETDCEIAQFSLDTRQNFSDKNLKINIDQFVAKRTESLLIKLESDKGDCCITGLAVCDNGNVILVDCYNKRLKLCWPTGDIIAYLDVPGEPFDIAVSDKGYAGVSMWMNQKEILLVDVKSNTLKLKGNIKLRNRIYGIEAIEDDFVLSCDDKIPSVRRVNKNGDTKWELAFNSDGRKVFKAPVYVVAHTNANGSLILVSDAETHTIALIDSKLGTLIKTIPQSKSAPSGLAVDDSNNIFVGCRLSMEIRIWSSTLENSKAILSKDDELKRPQAIAFSPITGELLMSSWRCNSIERFKISVSK